MAPVVGRIRSRSTLRALAHSRARAAHGPVSVAYDEADAGFRGPLVAYAIGRTVGTAVVRNRVRRRLREAVRSAVPPLPPGSYLVRVRPEASGAGYAELRTAVTVAAREAAHRAAGASRWADEALA
jgi:ribonuclease P protein component